MAEEKLYLDEKGYQQYLAEIEELKRQLQENSRSKTSSYNSAVGDGWHDNFEFEEAKRQELMIVGELERKIQGLKRIVIVENTQDAELINVNDVVRVRLNYGDNDIEEGIYRLIGGSNPNMNSDIHEITLNSPLGSSIYRKKVNTKTSFKVNGRNVGVEILEKILDYAIENETKKTR